jgi:6-phosphogluconate dehydrogenase (decarboxylating)
MNKKTVDFKNSFSERRVKGGPKEAYKRVRTVFEAAAAKVNGNPCGTWRGPGLAGHCFKMVHNGIEYSVMQLIEEDGLGGVTSNRSISMNRKLVSMSMEPERS